MTIRDAIEWLQQMEQRHGSAVVIYFDCPHCLHSFAPNRVETAAVRLTAALPSPQAPDTSR